MPFFVTICLYFYFQLKMKSIIFAKHIKIWYNFVNIIKIIKNMWNLETSSQTCEINQNQETPKIADTFNWSREEREKLNEEILVEKLRQKLIEKYPEQKCFFESAVIKIMQLWWNYERQLEAIEKVTNSNIFLLFASNWDLLSYLDQNWNTLFDISSFDFDNDFANLLSRRIWNSHIIKKDWKFVLFNPKDNTFFPEWSTRFNMYIYIYYLPKGSLK